MIRILLIALPMMFVAAPLGAQSKSETYAPKDGRFSVRFPGKPKESDVTAKSTIGDLKVHTATYAQADGNVFMTSYTDFPEGAAKPENRGTLYDGVREGLKGKDGKVISDTEIEFGDDKLPGKEFEIEKDKKRMKFRVALRDGRLYQVAAIGTANFVKGKDATAFLASFELTK